MSVKTEINRISGNVANTYLALEQYGVTMPETQNSDNLAKTVNTIAAVLYVEQEKTESEMAIARENIGAATTALYSTTIPTSGWSSSAPYSVQIALSGILSTDTPLVDIVQSGNESTDAPLREAWACITRITTAENSITVFAAEEKPTVAIPIQMRVVR